MNTSHRLSSLVLAAVALLGARATLTAQSVSPVPAPTIITTAPYTITQSGYYQLGANINYNGTGATNEAIITINASNVTLDFAGHYIAGPTDNAATHLFGIYAYDRANVVIQNGTISYCYSGMLMFGSSSDATAKHRNTRILNMTITKCYYFGMDLESAILPEVSNCRLSSIGGSTISTSAAYGIFFASSTGSKVSNCTIANVAATVSQFGAYGYGIAAATYAVGNELTNLDIGLYNCTKYKDNLTNNCGTPFLGGTAVGDNN